MQYRAAEGAGSTGVLPVRRIVADEILDLPAKSRLLDVQLDDAGKLTHFGNRTMQALVQLFVCDRQGSGKSHLDFLHFPHAGFRRGIAEHVTQLLGHAGQHPQPFFGTGRVPHPACRQVAHGVDDQLREAPLPGDCHAEILQADPQHRAGGGFLAAVLLQHLTADFVAFLREIIERQQSPQTVEQRADEGLLRVGQAGELAQVARQHGGQIGAQKSFLQLAGIPLVLQMFE